MTINVNVKRLAHCPENQLTRANPTDAGWDLAASKNVYVPTYNELYKKFDIQRIDSLKFWNRMLNGQQISVGIEIEAASLADIRAIKDSLIEWFNNTGDYFTITRHFGNEPEETEKKYFYFFNTDTQTAQDFRDVIAEELVKYEDANFYLVANRHKYKPLMIATGICLAADELVNYQVRLRSSMTKRGIAMAHSVGTIDYSYNNEIYIPVYAIDHPTFILKGEKIAQLIPTQQIDVDFTDVTEAEFVNSGRGGFGSTGV